MPLIASLDWCMPSHALCTQSYQVWLFFLLQVNASLNRQLAENSLVSISTAMSRFHRPLNIRPSFNYRLVSVAVCCDRMKANLLPGDDAVGKEASRYIRFASAAYGMLMLKVLP